MQNKHSVYRKKKRICEENSCKELPGGMENDEIEKIIYENTKIQMGKTGLYFKSQEKRQAAGCGVRK